MKRSARPILSAFTALAVVFAFAPAAIAGKAAPAPSAIDLNQTDPHLGGEVNFSAAYPRDVKYPRIAVHCYSGGTLTYAEAGPYSAWFVLGGASSDWQRSGGGADCIADLFYFTSKGKEPQQYSLLASTSFTAGP
jgi:hypothetical protein